MFTKLRQFLSLPWLEQIQRVLEFYWLLKTQLYYRLAWGHIGKRSKIINPMRLRNVHNMHIGNQVIINSHAFLLTLNVGGTEPRLSIGDGCAIGHMNHISCVREVVIGAKVLTADRVYISDHSHDFSDWKTPIMEQPVVSKGIVRIGDGSWIGENAVLLSCQIGRNCVIGSNAVVISDIPDYSVAVGAPARVVKTYNTVSGDWERVRKGNL